jgi:hypothetical protein
MNLDYYFSHLAYDVAMVSYANHLPGRNSVID